MKWKFYWRDIVSKYLVMLEGWPSNIPMANLSEVATSFPILEQLQHLWNTGEMRFRQLTEDEFQELDEARNRKIANGEVNLPLPRKIRSDKGKNRTGDGKHKAQKKQKIMSAAVIDSDSDASDKENAARKMVEKGKGWGTSSGRDSDSSSDSDGNE
jgi:hypothetical protein